MLADDIALSTRNISKKYSVHKNSFFKKHQDEDFFWALKEINFDLKKGEILGIIGLNGAGKSTLLKILSEIIPPTSGEIVYTGTLLSILEIGTGFHSDLSGYENIYLNASLLGMNRKEIEKKAEAIIEFSGIREFIHEPVKTYSNGMYLRLAFSIALHVDFDIILLDEVLSVGDAEFRIKALNQLREKISAGKAAIMISHELKSVAELCDSCIYLESGRIKHQGPTGDILALYVDNVENRVESKNNNITECPQCKFISCTHEKENYFLNESICLTITFEKRNMEDIDVVLKVKFLGMVIFTDCEIYRPDYRAQIRTPGIYQVNCIIPSDLFNSGNYKVDLLFGNKEHTLFTVYSAAKFSLKVPEWEVHKKWNEEEEPAPLRPRCNWQTSKLN